MRNVKGKRLEMEGGKCCIDFFDFLQCLTQFNLNAAQDCLETRALATQNSMDFILKNQDGYGANKHFSPTTCSTL